MAKKFTQSMIAELRKKEEERQTTIPFLFLPKEGGHLKVEMIDDTFSMVFEGEEGLDKRVVSWTQPECFVIDYADNRRKVFKPHASLASLMWLKTEEAGLDPLNMEGLVFDIHKDGYEHTVELVKTARFVDGDKHKDDETASEEQVREVVKKVITDNEDMTVKELLLWSKEYLREEKLNSEDKIIRKIISELKA